MVALDFSKAMQVAMDHERNVNSDDAIVEIE
jgi:hypothetical protein